MTLSNHLTFLSCLTNTPLAAFLTSRTFAANGEPIPQHIRSRAIGASAHLPPLMRCSPNHTPVVSVVNQHDLIVNLFA
jgi:hypothetical protein